MTETTFFHLAYYGYERTVIDSQVVTPAQRLSQSGIDMRLLFMDAMSGWYSGGWNKKQDALAKRGLKSAFLTRLPRNIFGINTFLIEQYLKPYLAAGTVVVHARGIQGAHAMLPLRRKYPNLRLICDVRGMDSAEYVLDLVFRKGRQPNAVETFWQKRLTRMEAQAVLGSDLVLCVSRSMIPRFQLLTMGKKTPFDYVPCAVDGNVFAGAQSQRDGLRKKLGIDGKLVFVYAGSLSAWQIPGTLLRVVRRALELIPDAVFLAITPQPSELTDAAARAGIPADRLVSVRANHSEIAGYLAAGDIGLLLREPNEVNKYACPTKFAEYLACGLHVLATTAVDEVASSIEKTGAGTLIDRLDSPESVDAALLESARAAREGERAARCATAAAAFDWSVHLGTLKKWYLRLSTAPSP